MTYDGDFEAYSDSAGAHQQGLDGRHLVEVHALQVAQRRWRRFSTVAYDVYCSCGWATRATYAALAYSLADEHADANAGEVMQTRRGNG